MVHQIDQMILIILRITVLIAKMIMIIIMTITFEIDQKITKVSTIMIEISQNRPKTRLLDILQIIHVHQFC